MTVSGILLRSINRSLNINNYFSSNLVSRDLPIRWREKSRVGGRIEKSFLRGSNCVTTENGVR